MFKTDYPVPYYAVIFTSLRTEGENGYGQMSEQMALLASQQEGYLGFESAHDEQLGISISYWDSLEAIKKWKAHATHQLAQQFGREKWYKSYQVRVVKVEKSYGFEL